MPRLPGERRSALELRTIIAKPTSSVPEGIRTDVIKSANNQLFGMWNYRPGLKSDPQ